MWAVSLTFCMWHHILCVTSHFVCDITFCMWHHILCVTSHSVCDITFCVWHHILCVTSHSVCDITFCVWHHILYVTSPYDIISCIFQMRSDSSQDLTFRRESDSFGQTQKQFSMDSLRHRGNAELDSSTPPNKANGPFGLCTYLAIMLCCNIHMI